MMLFEISCVLFLVCVECSILVHGPFRDVYLLCVRHAPDVLYLLYVVCHLISFLSFFLNSFYLDLSFSFIFSLASICMTFLSSLI